MHDTAATVDMFFTLASTARAAAGPRKATVWICFLTLVAGTPGTTPISSHQAEVGKVQVATSRKSGTSGGGGGVYKFHYE